MTRLVLAFILAACATSAVCAQTPVPKREQPIVGTPGELDILRTVAAPPAVAAAVSDVAGMLVVAHKLNEASSREKRQGIEPEVWPHLSLFRLDERGEATAPATKIMLPHSPRLSEQRRRNYPLALAAHPKLPLLYVWQDVGPPAEGAPPAPPDDPKTDGFRHLQVYDLSSAEPRLVQSLAEGESYSRGNWAGAMAFDRPAARLFIPNLQRRTTTTGTPSIGYLRLLEDGSVVPNEEEVPEVAGGGKGTTADRTGAVSAAARKVYLEQIRTGKVLDRTTRYATSATSTFAGFPCGLGYLNISDDVTIVCGALGPVTWDEGNRRAQFNSVVFFPVVSVGYRYRMAGHATLPVVYFTGLTSSFVYRVEHVDGFVTMLPQKGILSGVAALTSPPVPLGPRKAVACGSAGQLHVVAVDDEGRFTGTRTDVPVAGATLDALVYSPRFDKLYTIVPEVKK